MKIYRNFPHYLHFGTKAFTVTLVFHEKFIKMRSYWSQQVTTRCASSKTTSIMARKTLREEHATKQEQRPYLRSLRQVQLRASATPCVPINEVISGHDHKSVIQVIILYQWNVNCKWYTTRWLTHNYWERGKEIDRRLLWKFSNYDQ